ncbi:Protein tyrosine kinase/Protein kinase domain/Fungal protein kinase, putative [Leishmania lindenbergi]|uniref:Protein kinase domain-containing protein n=1 Tax=Leishmania lindenbergi TaxID=651832 RepID=A0AAW3AMF3_9TRYP
MRQEKTMQDFSIPLKRSASSKGRMCHEHCRSGSIGSDTSVLSSEEADPSGVMQDLDAAAAVAVASTSDSNSLANCIYLDMNDKKLLASKLGGISETFDNSEEDLDGDTGTSASRTGGLSFERTITDLPSTMSASTCAPRGKAVPLEVRRFQCTKSILAFKEATKNDATPVPPKLVDFIVSLTTSKNGLCTEKEMCDWMVAQMCDRLETGQMWVISKTSNLLFSLLWRGSHVFIESVHSNGKSLFQVSHLADVIKRTPQENITGERLPCSLQSIKQSVAGQRSACSRPKPNNIANSNGALKPATVCFLEQLKQKAMLNSVANLGPPPDNEPIPLHINPTFDIPERETGFFISNTAYMESLCEYRFRHPTLDLAHGEILCDADNYYGDGSADSASGGPTHRTHPAVWEELLNDTLELIKAIATTDPQISICPTGMALATTRLRNAVLLYQVACRSLVRLLHSIFTSLRNVVSPQQTGLAVPSTTESTRAEQHPNSIPGGDKVNGGCPAAVNFTFSSETARGFVNMHYNAIYQFNRTVRMFKAYCEATQHVSAEVARKAADALKLVPEDDFAAFREALNQLQRSECGKVIDQLNLVAQSSSQETNDGSVLAPSVHCTSTGRAVADSNSMSNVTVGRVSSASRTPLLDSSALSTSPLNAGVCGSLLTLYEFNVAYTEDRKPMWIRQVDAVCALFDDKESAILRQVFKDGVDELWGQLHQFTNNSMAAAERALMTSSESPMLAARRESSSVPCLLSPNGGGLQSEGRHVSYGDVTTRSSTYILRSLPRDVQSSQMGRSGSSVGKRDIISLNSGSESNTVGLTGTEKSTERSIEELLEEDDVVVICNEECSCNDTLKLIDRFQVLMDVPLGQGSYGKVFRAWDEVTGCYLAAKELSLDLSKAHNVAVREVLQEYTVLTELSHPNIVRVVAFMVMKESARIYMEWIPSGSLQDVLRHHPRGALRENVVRRYARDVVTGLTYLHSRGVIHRDVKPANMLLSSDGTVKLTDFGTSLVLNGNNRTLESNAITGTAAYMAPECVQGTYSSASDIWSFGCSLVQLLTGNAPWYNAEAGSSPEPIALLFKIGCLNDTTHLERPHDVLMEAPAATPTPSEVSASPSAATSPNISSTTATAAQPLDASEELINMLNSIFIADRKKRPSARDLLHHPFFKLP